MTAERIGEGPGSFVAGQEFKIRELVPAATPGAHDSSEDCYVLEWEEAGALRAWSVGVTQFNVDFEEV